MAAALAVLTVSTGTGLMLWAQLYLLRESCLHNLHVVQEGGSGSGPRWEGPVLVCDYTDVDGRFFSIEFQAFPIFVALALCGIIAVIALAQLVGAARDYAREQQPS